MTRNQQPAERGGGDHHDDTGPFLCECCDATHPGPRDPAFALGWNFTWDGYLCPTCSAANEEQEKIGCMHLWSQPDSKGLRHCLWCSETKEQST